MSYFDQFLSSITNKIRYLKMVYTKTGLKPKSSSPSFFSYEDFFNKNFQVQVALMNSDSFRIKMAYIMGMSHYFLIGL